MKGLSQNVGDAAVERVRFRCKGGCDGPVLAQVIERTDGTGSVYLVAAAKRDGIELKVAREIDGRRGRPFVPVRYHVEGPAVDDLPPMPNVVALWCDHHRRIEVFAHTVRAALVRSRARSEAETVRCSPVTTR